MENTEPLLLGTSCIFWGFCMGGLFYDTSFLLLILLEFAPMSCG